MAVASAGRNVVNDLMEYVHGAGYGPGDRLPPIRELSATLGIGRNAVRDGLLEAQTLGYVRIEPRLGVFLQDVESGGRAEGLATTLEKVLSQDEQNLFHLVDARQLLEVELAGEAARTRRPEDLLPLRQALEAVLTCQGDRLAFIQADEAFHLAIARMAGNRVLLAFIQTLLRLIRPAKMNLLLSADNREGTDQEHREIFQRIVECDVDRARAIMRAHLGKGRSLLLEYARSLPSARAPGG